MNEVKPDRRIEMELGALSNLNSRLSDIASRLDNALTRIRGEGSDGASDGGNPLPAPDGSIYLLTRRVDSGHQLVGQIEDQLTELESYI